MEKAAMQMEEDLKKIERVVHSLGLSGRARSSRQLILAVELAHRDKTLLENITKGLYIEVARLYGRAAGWKAVERNLRTARDQVWDRGDRARLCEIAGYPLKTRPTAGELVDMLCYYLETEGTLSLI